MYTLYYSPGACSLATQVILRELDQPFQLVNKNDLNDFAAINPVQAVPALQVSDDHGQQTLTEGVAILLYLLEKHPNRLLSDKNRQTAIQDMLFANATMHPAYGRLFFIANNSTENTQQSLLDAAAKDINRLWSVIENRLADSPFLGGENPSVADVLLAVYSRWGQYFPVEIVMGEKTTNMIQRTIAHPSFQASLAAESAQQEAA